MKKIILILAIFCSFLTANSQVTKTVNIADLTTDTTIFFTRDICYYNTSLGFAVVIDGLAGSGGTYEFLNSYSDTVKLVKTSMTWTIATDTIYAVSDVYIPFTYVGFRITKGAMTSGTIKTIIERKTRK